MNRMIRQSKLRSKREAPIIKFGVRVPRNFAVAVELDRRNGNTSRQDAGKTEMSTPREFTKIKTWLIFDVCLDLIRYTVKYTVVVIVYNPIESATIIVFKDPCVARIRAIAIIKSCPNCHPGPITRQ